MKKGIPLKNQFNARLKFGVAQKIFLISLALVLVPSILIGYFTYQSSAEELSSALENNAHENLANTNILVDTVVIPIMKDVEVLAKTFEPSTYDNMTKDVSTNLSSNEEITKILQNFKAVHDDDTETIGFARNDGAFTMEPQSPLGDDFDARTRVWYTAAMEHQGQVVISDPFVSLQTNNTVVSVATTTEQGDAVAVVNLSLKKYLTDTVNKQTIGDDGYIFIVDKTNRILTHPSLEGGTDVSDSFLKDTLSTDHGVIHTEIDSLGARLFWETNETTGWKIYGVLYDYEIDSLTNTILLTTVLMIVISIIIAAFIMLWVRKVFISPIKKMTAIAGKLSSGDLTAETLNLKNKDEIGDLAKAINYLKDQLQNIVGNLVNGVRYMQNATDTLKQSSENVEKSSQSISEAGVRVSNGAKVQTEGTSEIVRTMNETTIGVSSVAESASEISNISEETHARAVEGEDTVKQSVQQMQTIESSVHQSQESVLYFANKSSEIGKVASLISEIAAQTNLLSLNASIEAARAGEHGAGFSVVANEVKKLAAQSADAAKEISDMVNEITAGVSQISDSLSGVKNEVQYGVKLSQNVNIIFDGIRNSMDKLNSEIQSLSGVSQQMAASSEEVSSTVEELQNISKDTSNDSKLVLEATNDQQKVLDSLRKAVSEVEKTADTLREDIKRFHLDQK